MGDRCAHVVGFDDAPFHRDDPAPVLVVGAVHAGSRLDGVISTHVSVDGDDATAALAECVNTSRFATHLQAILLQGIAVAGFNVVDLVALHGATGLPVVAVARRRPRYLAIARALYRRVPGGRGKWVRLRRAGPMRPVAGLWVQAAGYDAVEAAALIEHHRRHSRIPEPVRVAHLIASGVSARASRQRV